MLCVLMGLTAPMFSAPITALFQTRIDPSNAGAPGTGPAGIVG